MEIIVAKNIGFCFGVTRAINESLKEINENTYLLGELVHNQETMKKIGGKVVENIDEIPEKSKVIIRAHGVPLETIKKAKEKKLTIVDLTCPKVAKVHELVSERKRNFIILIGKKNHPEVIGTAGYNEDTFIVESEEDLKELELKLKENKKKISIFCQTTFDSITFVSLVNKIKRIVRGYVEVIPCICPVTEERQKELVSIASNVELVLVIGGKNSSNTKKMYELAKEYTNASQIEGEEELNLEELKKYNKIGIVSGTSTNIDTVNGIISKLSELNN